jgi:hypothetical protein
MNAKSWFRTVAAGSRFSSPRKGRLENKRLKYRLDLFPLLVLPPFELFQPTGKFLVRGEELPKPDKGPHNGDVYLDRARGLRSTDESIAMPCSVNA